MYVSMHRVFRMEMRLKLQRRSLLPRTFTADRSEGHACVIFGVNEVPCEVLRCLADSILFCWLDTFAQVPWYDTSQAALHSGAAQGGCISCTRLVTSTALHYSSPLPPARTSHFPFEAAQPRPCVP